LGVSPTGQWLESDAKRTFALAHCERQVLAGIGHSVSDVCWSLAHRQSRAYLAGR